uniref:DDE-1 domain-containing protein n=1 Tax=Nothobranchius korthausae TaxID=1143690 RepID=A0A1A8FLA7_9TELE
MADKNIRPQHITNMDEVPLTFDITVNRTVEKMGTSTVSVWTTGHEKSCFTVVLACQADGQKLPPMVIFKRKTLPKEKFPAGVIIKVNPKGWMDEDMMVAWLRETGRLLPLICDSMRAHLTDAIKIQVKRMNTELTVILGGLTKELQLLDFGVNRSFKVKVRAAWACWMTDGEHTFTKTGKQRRSTYAMICEWIADAWANVSVQTVV